MGWLFRRDFSRSMIVEQLTTPYHGEKTNSKTIAHCLRGNVLWSVVEVTAKIAGIKMGDKVLYVGESIRFIGCHLLAKESGFGWGYKEMCESMHPYHYTCPLGYLEMVPVACKEWREKVYEHHGKLPQMASLPIQIPKVTPSDMPVVSLNQLSLL